MSGPPPSGAPLSAAKKQNIARLQTELEFAEARAAAAEERANTQILQAEERAAATTALLSK